MSSPAHIAAYRAVWRLRHGDGVYTPYDLTDEQAKGRYGTVMEAAQLALELEVRTAIEAYLREIDKIRCRDAETDEEECR